MDEENMNNAELNVNQIDILNGHQQRTDTSKIRTAVETLRASSMAIMQETFHFHYGNEASLFFAIKRLIWYAFYILVGQNCFMLL